MDLGSNQIAKISAAEASYGETVGTPGWAALGIVSGGEIGGKTSYQNIFGIGSATAQAGYGGKVENDLKIDLVAPTAAQMNKAITRTDGVLGSYNILVGDKDAAWRGVGLKWDVLTIEVDSENPLKASLGGIFKSILAAAVSGQTHAPGTLPLWVPEGLVLEVNDTPDTELLSCSINYKNNLKRKNAANGSNVPRRTLSALSEGQIEIDVTIQTMTAPSFDLEADCPLRTHTLDLTFTDLCGGGTPGTLVISLTGGMYIEKRQPLVPDGEVDYSIGMTFQAMTIT
jgi:hypothetical protein